jgi:hypothetical protein
MVVYKCLRWVHNLLCWTNLVACVEISTPSNGPIGSMCSNAFHLYEYPEKILQFFIWDVKYEDCDHLRCTARPVLHKLVNFLLLCVFNFGIVMYVPFFVFCVLFVCKCELCCCHWVSTQLRLNIYIYISYHHCQLFQNGSGP